MTPEERSVQIISVAKAAVAFAGKSVTVADGTAPPPPKKVPRCITCKCYRYSSQPLGTGPHHECRRNKSPIDGLPMVLDAEVERRLTGAGCCGPEAEYWEHK